MLRTIRWLLVALLPFLGFWVGNAFSPKPAPVWEVSFPKVTVFLGIVDEGKTALLIERDATPALDHNSLNAVIGYDVATGEQRFRTPLPDSLRGVIGLTTKFGQLSPDGNTILLIDSGRAREVLLYDWKNQKIIQQYRCISPEPYLVINGATMRGNTIAAYGFTFTMESDHKSQAFVTVWNRSTTLPGNTIRVGEEAADLHLSDDGKFAEIVTRDKNVYSQPIIDTVNAQKIFAFKFLVHDIRWSADNQRMYVLKQQDDAIVIETYERHGDDFKPTTSKYVSPTGIGPVHVGPYFATKRWARSSRLWHTLVKQLGPQGEEFLQRHWPSMVNFSLFHPETGETVRSVSIPETQKPIHFYPDPELRGFFTSNDLSLAYWSFDGVPTWPRWLGLFVGLALATLLAWRNLRRTIGLPKL